MTEWLAVTSLDHVDQVAGLRAIPGLEAAIAGDEIWIRGRLLDGDIPDQPFRELRKIPDTTFYLVTGDMLRPLGNRLSSGPLPDLEWSSMRQTFPVALPGTVLPAAGVGEGAGEELRLVPADDVEDSNLLVTKAGPWLEYVRSAPTIRLGHLTYTHDPATDRVVVRGEPLPPVPGTHFREAGGVALPCGLRWEHALDPGSVRGLVPCQPEDLVLFFPEGHGEVIPGGLFCLATRSSVRLTLDGASHV